MLKSLFKLLAGRPSSAAKKHEAVFQLDPPAQIETTGSEPLDFASLLTVVNDLPVPDWSAIGSWITSLADRDAQAQAWAKAELAWLAHMQDALGAHYHLAQHEYALVLSPLEPNVALATAQFMTKTLSRICRVLDGIAKAPAWGKDILLVFEYEETYYRYVSRYYPNSGEFAFSGGMHINFGCGHFATFQAELRTIEPVVAHEMTHGCLGHLSIPAWLNEGLAVSTEQRLCPPASQQYTPRQLNWMHRKFWNEAAIQEFWSGKSFLRPDEGNLLSYDLARILVQQLSGDWARFTAFVQQANVADAGQQAATDLLGVDLGAAVIALFDIENPTSWSPEPSVWESKPERGAF